MRLQATVEETMNTDVIIVGMEESIKRAAELMSKHRAGSVIVMGGKHLKGIVTAEDIVYKHVAKGQGDKVSDVMTKDPYTITPDKTIEEASQFMAEKRIKKLPVVVGEKIVGIITASDIIRIEPALVEILLEKLKMGKSEDAMHTRTSSDLNQCENCGNYADDIEDASGVWMCSACRVG